VTDLLLQAADWAPGLIDEQTLYRYTAIFLAACAVGFLAWTARLADRHRKYGLLATWVVGALAVTYFGMSMGVLRFENVDGNAVPLTRFVGYNFSIALIIVGAGVVAGASRRMMVVMLLPFYMIIGGTAGGWFLPDPFNSFAPLASLLSLPLIAYLLLRPVKRAAKRTTGNRALLYGKLANAILLVWIGYLVVGIVSRQSDPKLLDAFVGVFLGTYLDIIVHLAFGVLLLRHTGALDDMVGASDGGEAILDDTGDDPDAPAAAD